MSAPATYLDGKVSVFAGDCLDVIKTLPDNSVDAVVTDPPYALVSIVKRFGATGIGDETDTAARSRSGADGYARLAKGFMGKAWDTGDVAFAVEFWREVYRVMKPGAHVVSFGGTRTYHRLACAIEDAGFEIRDQIGWCFGTGFPKSHDVSKSIDRAGGVSPREQAVMLHDKREASGMTREQLAAVVGCTASSVRDWEEGRARATGRAIEWIVPSDGYREKLAETLGYSRDEREVIGLALDRRDDGTVYGIGHSGELRSGGNTAASRAWAGWGTALKPAWEPICLARKPLSEGTVAANVLRWGTGALNIDGCRVGDFDPDAYMAMLAEPYGRGGEASAERRYTEEGATNFAAKPGPRGGSPLGRWPANIIHDGSEEVIAAFPDSDGQNGVVDGQSSQNQVYGKRDTPRTRAEPRNDSGSAARFFYSSKADADDRLGSSHPTVKPVDLMQWLCRLVTPPNGTILDPFSGTGTTGEAAWREGFSAILIEREAEYLADIARRMSLCGSSARERKHESIKARGKAESAGPLFDGQPA